MTPILPARRCRGGFVPQARGRDFSRRMTVEIGAGGAPFRGFEDDLAERRRA